MNKRSAVIKVVFATLVAALCLSSISEASGMRNKKSPVTTKGDLYVFSTKDDRLAVGTDGMILSADSSTATGLKWVTPDTATSSGITGIAADAGGTTTGTTVTLAGGTNGIDTTRSTDTVTINFDPTEVDSVTWNNGNSSVWTWNTGSQDPSISFADGQINIDANSGNITLLDPITIEDDAPSLRLEDGSFSAEDYELSVNNDRFIFSNDTTGVYIFSNDSSENIFYGSTGVPSHTFTTNGSGDGEFKIPAGSIGLATEVSGTLTIGNGTASENAIKFKDNAVITDNNGNEALAFRTNANAVNYIVISPDATGKAPRIIASGDDANVGLGLSSKGTGIISADHALVPRVIVLTDAATIETDASQGNRFTVTLGGARTLGTPTNPTDGQSAIWIISQDATGSRTLAFSPVFRFGTTVTSPTLTTTAGSHDYIGAVYRVRGPQAKQQSWDVVATALGYAS